ncbi:MAG: DinB family protein [Thermomicrobiales bacterium]
MTTLLDATITTYGYASWATAKILDAAELLSPEQFTSPRPGGFGSVRDTLVHSMDAQASWINVSQGTTDSIDLDPAAYPDLATLRDGWAAIESATEQCIAGLKDDDLAETVAVQNSSGVARHAVRWQMLLHQANHAMQHRSEVAVFLTELGFSPGQLDLMRYLLENDLGAV